MLVLIAEFAFAVESRAEVLALAREMDAQTQLEEGCLHYVHAADVRDDGRLVLSEIWRDAAALQAHFGSAHFRRFQTSARALGVRTRVRQFEASELNEGDADYWKALIKRR